MSPDLAHHFATETAATRLTVGEQPLAGRDDGHADPALDAVPRAVEMVLVLKDVGEVRLLFSASNEARR